MKKYVRIKISVELKCKQKRKKLDKMTYEIRQNADV